MYQLISSFEWSLLVAKGAQIDQTLALTTIVYLTFINNRLISLIVDLLIQLFLSYLLAYISEFTLDA